LSGGDLPPGLKIESDGVVAGIPEESGEWQFTILVKDDKGNLARKEFRLLLFGPLPRRRRKVFSQSRLIPSPRDSWGGSTFRRSNGREVSLLIVGH